MSVGRTSGEQIARPRGRWRGPLFRLAAVLLALSPFLIFELLCWQFDWGAATDPADPFVAFATNRPLFERTADGSRWQVTPRLQRFFSDESFPAHKPSGTRRVFVVGESTVAGEPFGKPTSFPTWLQVALDATDGSGRWDIVNCGGISYASYRLAPMVEECLTHEPDLIVLAVGHNEFLEERTYAPIRATPAVIRSLYDAVERSRGFRVTRSRVLGTFAASKSTLPEEIRTRLDLEGGLEAYHRNEAGRRAVIAHYEFNLRRMVNSVQAAGVPLILIRQPSNLADCPPFKSDYAPGLSPEDCARCDELVAAAQERLATDLPAAVLLLEEAVRIDPTFARTQYELGKCYEALGDTARARQAYIAARDHDVCPLRMLSEMEQILAQVAAGTRTPLVDLHALLEQETPTGILGGFLLVDHVHPSMAGHQRIAKRLLMELDSLGLYQPRPNSQAAIDAAFAEHLASLDPQYFLRGQRSLRSLQAWAAGRAPYTPMVTGPEPKAQSEPTWSPRHE